MMNMVWTPEHLIEKVDNLSKDAIKIFLIIGRELLPDDLKWNKVPVLTRRADYVRELGVSRKQVDAAIDELKAAGLISTRKRWMYVTLDEHGREWKDR